MNAVKEWELEFAAAYIVNPARGQDEDLVPEFVRGAVIAVKDIPLDVLRPLFERDADEYHLGIIFPPQEGEEKNPIRELIQQVANGAEEAQAQAAVTLAHRLASVTRAISRRGLLMFLTGRRGGISRVVIWKFTSEETLQAFDNGEGALVREVENAFSTESGHLKAAMFEGTDAETSFQDGRVEDKQSKHSVREVADFWMLEFLLAQPETTDGYYSRMLGKAIRLGIEKTDSKELKQALILGANSIKLRGDRRLSFRDFATQYLPAEAADHFMAQATGTWQVDSQFRLDSEIFDSIVKYTSIVTDDDFVITGPSSEFDKAVEIEEIDQSEDTTVIVRGRIRDRKLKSVK